MENNETFRFTYSAAQQAEVQKIRDKYMPQEVDKMERLRQLDRSVTKKAQSWAITIGVIGALVMGTGMSLAMTELGAVLGIVWDGYDLSMLIGVGVGLAGMVLVALAYPVYNRIVKKERSRIAPEIIRLSDELMQP